MSSERLEELREKKRKGDRLRELRERKELLATRRQDADDLISAPIDYAKSLKNLPDSVDRLADDMLMPINHPIDFSKGLYDLLSGFAAKAHNKSPLMTSAFMLDPNADSKIPMADAAVDYYEGYGDTDTRRRRVEEDPAGVGADAAALATGGLSAVNKLSKLSKSYPSSLPEGMYEEVGKFSLNSPLDMDDKGVKNMVRYLLENDVKLSSEGVQSLKGIITDTSTKLDEMIALAGQGVEIPKTKVLNPLVEYRSSTIGKPEGIADRKVIDKVIGAWIDEIKASGKDVFTLPELQQFKKDMYNKITWKGSNKRKTKNEAYRKEAQAAREIIEENVPEAKDLNAHQGAALEATPFLQKAVKRIDRKNKLNAMELMKPVGLEGLTTSMGLPGVGTALGAAWSIAGQDGPKSALARALYKHKMKGPPVNEDALVKAMLATYPQLFAEQQEQ